MQPPDLQNTQRRKHTHVGSQLASLQSASAHQHSISHEDKTDILAAAHPHVLVILRANINSHSSMEH